MPNLGAEVHIDNPKSDDSLRKRLCSSAFWSLFGAILARSAAMVVAVVTARILSIDNFGKLSIITSTTAMFATFAGLGLGVTCTRYVAQLRYSDPRRTQRIIRLLGISGLLSGGVMALFALIAAPFIAASLLAIPDLTTELRIASLLLLTDTLNSIQSGTLAGLGAFRQITHITIIQGCASLPLAMFGVSVYGIRGAVLATVISSIITLALSIRVTHKLIGRHTPSREEPTLWSEAGLLWRLSLPVALSGIVVTPAIWLGNTILARSAGGYGQLGIFNAAQQWRFLLSFLPSVLGNVLLFLVSENISEENTELEAVNILAGWLLVSFPALLLIVFPEVTGLVYGRKYDSPGYHHAVVLLALTACLVAYKEGIARRLIAGDLIWWGVLSNVFWGLLFAGLIWWYSVTTATGLAIIYLVCFVASTLMFVPLYLKKGVVSRRMLASKGTGLVWLVLFLATRLVYEQTTLLIRVPFFLAATAALAYAFAILWRRATGPATSNTLEYKSVDAERKEHKDASP